MPESGVGLRPKAIAVIVIVLLAAGVGFLRFSPWGSRTAGDRQRGAPPTQRVLIIGLDGLDWTLVDRVSAGGGMPNMARLRREGAHGVLHSIPPFLSPSIWTSVATGKTEEKHGIVGFLADRGATADPTPMSSNMRRAEPLWRILSSAGRTVGFVGWLVTWPAEQVNGYMISSRTNLLAMWGRAEGAAEADLERLRSGTYPPELYDSIADLRVAPEAVSPEEIEFFLGATSRLDEPGVGVEVGNLTRIYAGDLTTLRIARHLLSSWPVDLSAIYLRGLDSSCHMFWKYSEPASWSRSELPPRMIEIFSPVIDRYYVRADSMIGVILAGCDEKTTVILCSDHGFAGHRGHPGFEGGLALGPDMHREEGAIAIRGPDVVPGVEIEDASVLDVAPTVLALFGLPVGRDMDGSVLEEVIRPSFLARHPVTYLDTYETSTPTGEEEPIPSPVDDVIKERLRSLGYIE